MNREMALVQVDVIESERMALQSQLDRAKSQAERNKLGQYSTPLPLALQILQLARQYFPATKPIRFLDPAFGTGSFFTSLLKTFSDKQIEKVWGYEIDPHYGLAAQQLWSPTNLELSLTDFTKAIPPEDLQKRANLIICNPPYVRHHHLTADTKQHLQAHSQRATRIQLSGLAGLYCYFLLIAHEWLADEGIACWLVPSEFMDVNYGQRVKQYLLTQVRLLQVHRFRPQDTQFTDALVSSVVLVFQKAKPSPDHQVKFTSGEALIKPETSRSIGLEVLLQTEKWTRKFQEQANRRSLPTDHPIRLMDLFNIKRGIATGANSFFILSPDKVEEHGLPDAFLKLILPSPRYLETDEILSDKHGNPLISKKRYLLDCNLPESRIKADYPALWNYLQTGIEQGIHLGYLCRNRTLWYAQEIRQVAPLLCTYMGRNERPFRFILNHSQAIAANVYLMLYPKPFLTHHFSDQNDLLRDVRMFLCQIDAVTLVTTQPRHHILR